MMNVDEAAEVLRIGLPTLTGSNAGFAESLLKAYHKKYMTAKQEYWIIRLASNLNAPAPEVVTVNVTGIYSLMQTAASRLKYPKIRMMTEAGEKLVISIAGARSRYNGQLMLTDGGPFGANVFYGRVDTDGNVVQSRDMTATVLKLLREFSDNPAGVAGSIGKRTGACCFCARELETTESLAVGYGPVCADKFSLPWG